MASHKHCVVDDFQKEHLDFAFFVWSEVKVKILKKREYLIDTLTAKALSAN